LNRNKFNPIESDQILCWDCSYLEKNVEKDGIKYICTARARRIIDLLKVKRCFRYSRINKGKTCGFLDSQINLKDATDYFDTRLLLKIASGTSI
jgi:hypothetical protein